MTLKECQDKAVDAAMRWDLSQMTLGEYKLIDWPRMAVLLMYRIDDLERDLRTAEEYARKVQEQAAHIRDAAAS